VRQSQLLTCRKSLQILFIILIFSKHKDVILVFKIGGEVAMVNNDNSQKGLDSDNMDEQAKHDIQSKGGQASRGGGGQNQNDFGDSGSGSQQDQDNQKEDSSGDQGFASMKEDGRDEEVTETASLGGQASQGGGKNQE